MISASKIRNLAKNYKLLTEAGVCIEKYLSGDLTVSPKLLSLNIKTDTKNLRMLKGYISLYETMFKRSLLSLSKEDKQAAEEIYIKKRSVISYSMDNYICESKAYKSLKAFDVIFYYNILKVSRIINPLLDLCIHKRRPRGI